MRQVPWSITDDRGRCVDLGTVPAESDQDALRAVLARPRKDLRAQGWYRVKAGGAVASAAGDVAREEAGVPAPRRSSGGCVLAVDTVRISSSPDPMRPVDVLEASGNCANCGRVVRGRTRSDPFGRYPLGAVDLARRAAVDDLRRFLAGSPCPALQP